jgi:hypothetical protein
MANEILTQDLLLELFEYQDGILRWKNSKGSRAKAGQIAGSDNGNGYRRIRLNKKLYYSHRIIFMMFHGWMPNNVDHIDQNTFNSKIENLRAATDCENAQNRKLADKSKSGIKGVFWQNKTKKWRSCIRVNGKRKHLGYYDDIQEAKRVIMEARVKYHGSFANHG